MNYHPTEGFQVRAAVIVVALLFSFSFISLTVTRQKSLTFDEPLHIYAGYSYLKWRDFRVNPEHPPLAKVLAALPLLALDINTTGITRREREIVQWNQDYGWVLANRLVFHDNDAEKLFFYAKLVMVGLAVVLGLVILLWARDLYGFAGGIAALFMYTFDPNILAHSSLIQTDVPFTLFFFAGTYFFWRTLNIISWFNLLMTSLCFAAAVNTKFSFLAILPAWGLLGIIKIFSSKPIQSYITSPPWVVGRWGKTLLVTLVLASSMLVGYIGISAVYGFRFDAIPYPLGQLPVGRLVMESPWLGALVRLNTEYFFLPEAWLYGLIDAYKLLDRQAFLLGDISDHGFWLYFLVAFTVKTPLPVLVTLLAAVAFMILRWRPNVSELFLWVPIVVFFSIAVWSHMNLGLRHVLPLYPFLFVFLGGAVARIWKSGGWASRCGLLILGIWLVASSVRAYPNYLAFFNELAGGSSNGHRILVDSNLDWGQDLKGLKQWMISQGVDTIQLAYFGTADPAYYRIKALYLPGSLFVSSPPLTDVAKSPPYVAISATYLAGLYLANKDTYAAFRGKKPVASIGHSILVYRTDR